MEYLAAVVEDWSSTTCLAVAAGAALVALVALLVLSILTLEAVLETAQ